ncbi:MAG: 4Fe-4S dicluster domain-containing protein [Methanothrix sp.]|nr:4Fe-4S dicluster domain-containing protein [Methanothrix sp.]
MRAFLPRECLAPWLERQRERMEVIAPVLECGAPVFTAWGGQRLALEGNPLMPPSELLLPLREVLFRYEQDCGRYSFQEPDPVPRMIFGIRPCDLQALAVLDRILGTPPADRPYIERRRSTVIVACSCTEPEEGCFCASLGSGPMAVDWFDLELTELSEGFLVRTGSSAGVVLIVESRDLFREAGQSEIRERDEVLRRAAGMIQARGAPSLPQIREAIERADWEALARRCLGCGSCTYLCPICHCFTIHDLGVPDGERLRCRDTCLLSGFSRMAGGINPYPEMGSRLENWYRDKFCYTPQRTGLTGCVGCGRCSRACLGGFERWSLEVRG